MDFFGEGERTQDLIMKAHEVKRDVRMVFLE